MKTLVLYTADRDLIAQTPWIGADIIRVDNRDDAIDAIATNLGEVVLAYGADAVDGYDLDAAPIAFPSIVLCTDSDTLDWRGALSVGASLVVQLPVALDALHDHLSYGIPIPPGAAVRRSGEGV